MTSAQVVETSVNVISNSPSQDYTHPDDRTLLNDMTPGFKPFTNLNTVYQRYLWAVCGCHTLPEMLTVSNKTPIKAYPWDAQTFNTNCPLTANYKYGVLEGEGVGRGGYVIF